MAIKALRSSLEDSDGCRCQNSEANKAGCVESGNTGDATAVEPVVESIVAIVVVAVLVSCGEEGLRGSTIGIGDGCQEGTKLTSSAPSVESGSRICDGWSIVW